MNRLNAELVGRFDSPGDCNKLLYAPLAQPLTFRKTRLYHLEYEGNEDAARAFAERVLGDPVSEELHVGDEPAIDGFCFYLDYGMKPGALDNEKEAIMRFAEGSRSHADFELKSLKIDQRIYVFGEGAEPAPFVRDIVNPAIHTCTVTNADPANARDCA